ncbi:zinc finger protein 706-like isoform X1 [Cimex lectularius]|uniref:Small EDRK-rich factor-like N-terminal domain-containing protein n=1 Tax=Cimex lectularius TaxID=79782 RepID=A0A8I6SK90_CIMLE|nr:zinc finger protein 706-like isoform X1 [Cimex lectularius]
MARGHQKIQSQAKAAERAAKAKKQQGHNANSQKKAAQKALVFACAICKKTAKDKEVDQFLTMTTLKPSSPGLNMTSPDARSKDV